MAWTLTRDGSETIAVNHGDEEDFRSLMLDVRKFVLQEEAANFNAVSNLLYQRLSDDTLRNESIENRSRWDETMKGHGVYVDANRQPIRADHMLDVVIYGGMFHESPDRIAEWQSLDPAFRELYRTESTIVVVDCVAIAADQRDVIQRALDSGDVSLDN